MTATNDFDARVAALPRLSLGAWPTPITELSLPDAAGPAGLWVKRDDLAGGIYGGNKIRKLEYLLADALERDARAVMTFGVAGSNHALATAICARRHGLLPIAILTHQTNSRYVAKNLLMHLHEGTELHVYASAALARLGSRWQRVRHRRLEGRRPVIVPGGGSSALGAVGFVGAAFELAAQVDAGELPAPDVIYVALGTMGTAAGLLLGLRAAGLQSRVVAVRVVREDIGNRRACMRLAAATRTLLARHDAGFAQVELDPARFTVRDDFFGPKYAVFNPQGVAAIREFGGRHGLTLEGTYTGKTAACLLADIAAGSLRGQKTLFWNTYSSKPLQSHIAGLDYRELPRALWRYFETPVQPLDR